MAQVKVWNDNVFPYKETFREKDIHIPAKGFIEMDQDEAQVFKGTFSPIRKDHDGKPTVESYKMIRLEIPPQAPKAVAMDANLCMACRYLALSAKDLETHQKDMHSSQVLVDEALDQELKAKAQAQKKSKAG